MHDGIVAFGDVCLHKVQVRQVPIILLMIMITDEERVQSYSLHRLRECQQLGVHVAQAHHAGAHRVTGQAVRALVFLVLHNPERA